MAAALQLQIHASGGDFAFDVEGEWTPRVEPVYRAASEPPELEQLLWTWEFRGCRIVPADGATSTLWTDVLAFLAYFEDRDDHPTYARLIRDPSGAAAEVLRIGSPTYESLRFGLIEGEQDPQLAAASWSRTATFGLRITAARKFADANGIVGWQQTVRVAYEAGLRVLEWDTEITTADGTDAVAKAKAFAAIDIAALPAYSYQTNGPDGIEWEELDADEVNGRTVTAVQAISRVREWGVTIGASAGGTAPDDVELEVTTETTPEEVRTTTFARARGPNAEQWVLAQKPAGSLFTDRTVLRSATNEASGFWERRTTRTGAAVAAARVVEVTVSGGGRAVRVRSIAAGLPPVVQRGAFLPYQATVAVTVRRQGGSGLVNELPFPAGLGGPWILDTAASSEGDPYIVERGRDSSQHVWERKAALVYQSAEAPGKRPSVELATAADVTSYLLSS